MKTPRISLDKKTHAKLKVIRGLLAKELSEVINNSKARTALDDERQALEEQIESLEKSSLSDSSASKVCMKREKLRQVNMRLAAADDRPANDEALAYMSHLLTQFRPLIQRAASSIQQSIEQEIIAALAPYFGRDFHYSQILSQSIPHQKIANFFSRQWGMLGGNSIPQAKDAIKIIDCLLAGKSPIKF